MIESLQLVLVKIVAIMVFCFVSASWLLPNHYFPWVTAYQEFASFAAVLALGFFSLFWGQLKVPGLAWVFVIMAVVPMVQWSTGLISFFGDALISSLYLFVFAITISLGYSQGEDSEKRKLLILLFVSALLFCVIISVWIALRQWFMLPGSIWVVDLRPGGRPFANFAQPNNFASFLVLGLLAVLYLYEKRQLAKITASLLSVFVIFGLALSQSRTPWLVVVVLCCFWFWKARDIAFRTTPKCFVGWVFFYFLLVFLLPFIADFLLLQAASPWDRARSGLQRLELWQQLLNSAVHAPWFGYGWNQISVAQVSISLAYPVDLMVEHSHNILIDALLWNGVVLGALFIFVVGASIFRLILKAKSVESVFCIAALLGLLIHGFFEFPLEYAFFLLPMGFLLGLSIAESGSLVKVSVPKLLYSTLLSGGLILFTCVWVEYRVIEEDSRSMRFETASIGNVQPGHGPLKVILLTQLREFIRFARTPASSDMSLEELEQMRKVASRYPYPPSIFRFALALAMNGRLHAAEQQLLILRALHPPEHYAQAVLSLKLMVNEHPDFQLLLSVLPQSDH